MTPREIELLVYYGKKALNWLFVLCVAGYILWIAAPRLAILLLIVLAISMLFVARDAWKTYRKTQSSKSRGPKTW